MTTLHRSFAAAAVAAAVVFGPAAIEAADPRVPAPGQAEVQWKLGEPPMPADNASTPQRVALGKALFFDPRLSGNGASSCATCHNPSLGWSDGQKTAVGFNGAVLGRATPTIVNAAYNTQFMWDGRKKSLEDQALGPMQAPDEMNADFAKVLALLNTLPGYKAQFAAAYPGEPVGEETLAKALAAFERTVVSRDSPFDRWLAGDTRALTPQQHRGFQVFADPARGNCAACHNGPNLTDNGFHNIGLAGTGTPDLGRFNIRKVAAMKGAFKTPTLRDIELTAPYFHDGSAATLREVVDHYVRGGDDRGNVSADMRPLKLSEQEKDDLVAFMRALTGPRVAIDLPILPQ
ncbi:MAG: cpx [Ramlibacter sp.]|jgi:cytochrome c peroxidase|nr:cpx [Ramlibacter sp.]MCE3270554.1 cpx [Ramlibacter sp.]